MPSASETQEILPSGRGLGLSLLGTAYERKKNKLQLELQQDYKHYVAMKKDLKTSEPQPQPQALSLPIDEKVSVQEKLREERNKEYNVFLHQQAHVRRLKWGTPPATLKSGQVQASDAVRVTSPASPLPTLNTHTDIHPPPREHPASRRDAATLTEAVDYGKRTGTRGPGRRGRRHWQFPRLKGSYSSEEELITDTEGELKFRHWRRQDRHTPEPEDQEGRSTRIHRANRAPQDMKEVEPSGVHHQDNNEWFLKSDLQMLDNVRKAASCRPAASKDKAEIATGLIIGAAEERTASQMRKEQYKRELLKQIDEQQRNKIREKKLELSVAATGATDPEKEPDRIKQFGAGNSGYDSRRRDVPYMPGQDLKDVEKDANPRPKDDKSTEEAEQRAPPGQSHMDYSTALSQLTAKTVPGSRVRAAQGVPSLGYFNEDYHRNFSNILGEAAFPRVAGFPPPVPPTVTSNYQTPYDAAYYYYGTRNPLDPDLPYSQNGLPEGVQKCGNFHSPPQIPLPLRSSLSAEATDQYRSFPLDFGEHLADKAKQRRESALSYQEALRQQIKEREERKRREKEEKERYDAKIEAEIMAYNPWGTTGGGAPIKDQKGNLVSDLNQKHRINEESYWNPTSRNRGQTQSSLMRDGHTPGFEARAPLSHQLSDPSDQPTQDLHIKDIYKKDLKKQIEENKQRKEKQREQMRVEAEKDEKRLAAQRALIQREYEEENRKQMKVEHRLKNQGWIHEPKTQHQGEETEIGEKVPESASDREEKREQLSHEREPSLPIPALQRKQSDLLASRPVVSQVSSSDQECSVSAPHCPQVPVKVPQLQDGQQEVLRELSALRRYLRREQKQLEVRMDQTDRQEIYHTAPNRPRGRPRVDAFELARKQTGAASVHMQNIREFNQLKYRDTASREQARHAHPDPPTDHQSLDIQQQTLLREQRKIKLKGREEEHTHFLDQKLSHYSSRNKPERYIHRDYTLPSESTYFYVHSACEERDHEQRPSQHSAEHQERTAQGRRHDYDEVALVMDQRKCNIHPDAQSLQLATVSNLESQVRAQTQPRITRRGSGDHNRGSEGLPDDEVDVSSLRSARERCISVETVATEPWLRPGTSDAVKRLGCRERPNSRMDAQLLLTHHAT